jgi:cold shock CspA family protein
MRGKIASISPEQGFGFITPDEEGGELSFPRSALHGAAFDDLSAGDAVEFLLGQESGARPSDGLRVVDVRLANETALTVNREGAPAAKLGQS